ncbi:MAG: class I tRNA ligase family protein [Thaumarchaeota archaeon]|nr:class I tRNA ligase family protein [Nitrososphaerota archaeon]
MITKLARRPRQKLTLSAKYDWKVIEDRVREFYDSTDVHRLIARRYPRKKPIGYVEGPPTLNAQPHVGHVRGRVFKDVYFRHSTLSGRRVVFRGGWDAQGLPVELQAEKELGLTGNKWENLKKVGVERLVQTCKELILKVQRDWLEADRLMGLLLDQKRAYMTYRDSYIEREWKYLETAWRRGLLGEGFKVVAYCPSCQTSLSHAEVSLGGYEKLEDPSLYYKVRSSDGSFLVVWTTMPFTVVTDELVAVEPEADYEYVNVGTETWVVCSDRKQDLAAELGVAFGRTVKTVKGTELRGLKYTHPLLDRIPGLAPGKMGPKVHSVVAEDFVDTTTGTGLVHLAPANGEDDFAVAQKMKIPVFAPFDDQVRFTDEAGAYAGLFVRDADRRVVGDLESKGALVKSGSLVHDYPVCWRSGHRIVWLARREYFYWVDRVRDKLVKAAEGVEYFFESPRNRFVEFIRESPPWGITRERVWGTPLPVWSCEKCGEKTGAFSRKRILRLASELPDGEDFELHRPWIDRVVLKCPNCGGRAIREPFVLDAWHNSGASPYASFTDEEFRSLVPVGFLTEGIDQTRGWAYTLLVLNVIMTGRAVAPYGAFLFQGHVLDEEGRKMSKSLGNTMWGLDLLRNNSADVSRFYLTWKGSPEDSLSLDVKEMAGRPYQVANTLYHLHLYLSQNGPMDGFDPRTHTLDWARRLRLLTQVDRWLLAKVASARRLALQAYSGGQYNVACRLAEDLVISSLSQTYVRLVRGELWKDDPEERQRRLAVFAVLGHVLRSADELLHPVMPFLTEFLHQEVFAAKRWASPMMVGGLTGGEPAAVGAEGAVDFALKVEEACNSSRTRARLKRRWPLSAVTVLVTAKELSKAKSASRTVASLCNVKRVEVVSDPDRFPAAISLVPNRSKVGALFKERTKEVLASLSTLKGRGAVRAFTSGRPAVRSGNIEVPLSAFELVTAPAEGYEVSENEGVFVAIRKERDEELVAEGLVRDVSRRLQALRKKKGYVPTQMLNTASVAGLEAGDLALLEPRKEEIAFLVRVSRVVLTGAKYEGTSWEEDDIDGRPVYLDVR